MSGNTGRAVFTDAFMHRFLQAVAAVSVLVLLLIFLFLAREGLGVFAEVSPGEFLLGNRWMPVSDPPFFGSLPLFAGSLAITLGAALLGIPAGLGIALYLSEGAPTALREWIKVGIELLAGIPSVVYGFVGLMLLAPLVRNLFGLESGLTVFTASVVLGIMILPTVASIAEDALQSVPRRFRAASLALGASSWETAVRVVAPAARSGLVAASLLGVGRAIGETMAVLMVAGNMLLIPTSPFAPARTVTAAIAAEMGEVVFGGLHYQALFALGLVLFLITFAINLLADLVLKRGAAKGGVY